MEIKLFKIPGSNYYLWEERGDGGSILACRADGGRPCLHKAQCVLPKQAMVPVKKGYYILIGKRTAAIDEVIVLKIVSLFSTDKNNHYANAELVNSYFNGAWQKELQRKFVPAVEVMFRKLNGEDAIFASSPLYLPLNKSAKGYPTLYEECGKEQSTIVSRIDGRLAKAVYIFQKPKGVPGKQAVVEVHPQCLIWRGKRAKENCEINVYSVEQICRDEGQLKAKVKLLNRCNDGKWQRVVPLELRSIANSLMDKIEEIDMETVLSKL